MFSGSGTATVIDFLDEDNMASNSATAVPSQQSVKAYVDSSAGVVMLDSPVEIVGPNLVFNTWTTVNNSTLGTAGATVAILRIMLAKASDANDVFISLRKTGTSDTTGFANQVARLADTNGGATYFSTYMANVWQALDANSDFDYYYTNASGVTLLDEGSIYLIGYYA
jgi:hypothetical protein